MLINPPTQSDLLALLSTCRRRQLNGHIPSFKGYDPTTSLRRSDIDKQGFTDGEFGDFGFFRVVRLDT